jgi:hypothetical protein
MIKFFLDELDINKYLTLSQQQTLKILVWLIQVHKVVTLEKLAANLSLPILYESRRKHIQRFLVLPNLSLEKFWLPIIKKILKEIFDKDEQLFLTIDRTAWGHINVFMLAVIYQKRAIPIYWRMLEKKGSSNLLEQQQLLAPVLKLLADYNLVILGDREFHSIHLSNWLEQENKLAKNQINFAFRQKKNTYIGQEDGQMLPLNNYLLVPGVKQFFQGLKVTKYPQLGYGNMVIYQKRSYRGKRNDEPWYILTNFVSGSAVISAYSKRTSIEAMFKDYKSGGYNLEGSHANTKRTQTLILLIAIAYTQASLKGEKIKSKGLQKYICRLKDKQRRERRHSNFWVGLYGESWTISWDYCWQEVNQLMALNRNKLKFYDRGLKAMSLILSI